MNFNPLRWLVSIKVVILRVIFILPDAFNMSVIHLAIQLLFIIKLAECTTDAGLNEPVVNVKHGTIIGKRVEFEAKELDMRTSVDTYLGIPYAEAPIGPLRFKPPVPKKWSGELNAKEIQSACPQPILPLLSFTEDLVLDEDCLSLDVYVPVPTPSDAAVMIWIHGGGYSSGTGSVEGMDSSPIAAIGDVIVVAIQYRLGALGFLSTGDEEVPGNMGMLDQIEAMKWVQDNIAAFGGDPSRVTIFGESAGAGSVSIHTLSPLSKGLFTGAIMQSGVAGCPWAVNTDTNNYFKRASTLGDLVGCSSKESKQLVECLMNIPADDLVNASTFRYPEAFPDDPALIAFAPIVDGNVLPEAPSALIEKGLFNPADVMVGFNADEGMVALLMMEATEKPSVNRTVFENLLAMLKISPLSHSLQRGAFDQVYLDDAMYANPDDADYVESLSQLYGDYIFGCPSDAYIRASSEADLGHNYLYFFTHVPSVSIFNLTWTGSCHGDELIFFGAPFLPKGQYILTEEEVQLTAKMIRYWTNFAKTGNPNMASKDEEQNENDPEWPQFSVQDPMYRELSTNMKTGRNLKAKQCSLWNDYLPKLEAAIAVANGESCKSHWTAEKETGSCDETSNP